MMQHILVLSFEYKLVNISDMQKLKSELSSDQQRPDPWRRTIDCFDACYFKYESCYCRKNTTILDCDNIDINKN